MSIDCFQYFAWWNYDCRTCRMPFECNTIIILEQLVPVSSYSLVRDWLISWDYSLFFMRCCLSYKDHKFLWWKRSVLFKTPCINWCRCCCCPFLFKHCAYCLHYLVSRKGDPCFYLDSVRDDCNISNVTSNSLYDFETVDSSWNWIRKRWNFEFAQ